MKIYVVMGSTGEYSDHQKWSVCYYEDEVLAIKHVELASARSRDLLTQYDAWNIPKEANEYDKKMYADYTGVNYYVVEVDKGDIQIQ